MFDLFGLRKDIEKDSTRMEPEAPAVRLKSPRSFWARVLVLDGLVAAGFAAALLWRSYDLLSSQAAAPVRPARPPALKPKAAEPAKAPSPPPAPAPRPNPRAAPPKAAGQAGAAPPAPPEAPAPKGPIGSPSVNAPELPQRGTPSPAAGAAQADKGDAAQPQAQEDAAKPRVKSVDFTYTDLDAKSVTLLGPFLVRTGGRKPMTQVSNGVWQTSVYLGSGTTYHYRFEVVNEKGEKTLSERKTLDPF